ncbi:Metallo-dependent hydrolase [Macrolepiota fuliginosa MF-IS2]|uniref:Metallo-dependent hydrolase n=1 Tax=Macrolepiota fuliginosa MF-IS2 TaxID=1400762 RepID=A0A9P6C511_9AGAR|nr:Metallo-dependent hydrolase [Macrolepiota fuliginosa MF-IS2]
MPTIAGPAAAAFSSLTPSQRAFIYGLPKAELHAHLNGSIPIDVLQDLARDYSSQHAGNSDTNNSVSGEAIKAGLEKLRTGVTLDEIHDFFGLFPAIYALTSTPEALERATRGVLDAFFSPTPTLTPSNEDSDTMLCAPECTYLELRTTPRQTPSMSYEIYLRTVLQTCSSYTSTLPPLPQSLAYKTALQRRVGVIASLDRRMSRTTMHEIINVVVKLKEEGLDVVGVDLCGDPTAGDVEEFRYVFRRVAEAGLGVTLHIAETLKNSPEETLKLLSFNPDRLGHATFLDEQARDIVLKNKTCIEICLTSNLLCKTVPDLESHHIQYWLTRQHPIAICTDDILPFRNSLTAEYALLLAEPPLGLGLTEGEVRMIAEMSLYSRFSA